MIDYVPFTYTNPDPMSARKLAPAPAAGITLNPGQFTTVQFMAPDRVWTGVAVVTVDTPPGQDLTVNITQSLAGRGVLNCAGTIPAADVAAFLKRISDKPLMLGLLTTVSIFNNTGLAANAIKPELHIVGDPDDSARAIVAAWTPPA